MQSQESHPLLHFGTLGYEMSHNDLRPKGPKGPKNPDHFFSGGKPSSACQYQ
jgi:hypothetical protein